MTARRPRARNQLHKPTGPRRGLRREDAAAYVGISPTLFDTMVAQGRLPMPIRFNSATVWDMWQLDLSFPGTPLADNDNSNPWG